MQDKRVMEFLRMLEVFVDDKGTSSIERMAIMFAVIMKEGLASGLPPDMFKYLIDRGLQEYRYAYKTRKGD